MTYKRSGKTTLDQHIVVRIPYRMRKPGRGRFAPLGSPLVAADVFGDPDTLDRTAGHALLAKGIFSAGLDLSFRSSCTFCDVILAFRLPRVTAGRS